MHTFDIHQGSITKNKQISPPKFKKESKKRNKIIYSFDSGVKYGHFTLRTQPDVHHIALYKMSTEQTPSNHISNNRIGLLYDERRSETHRYDRNCGFSAVMCRDPHAGRHCGIRVI